MITIRTATAADAAEIARIHVDTWRVAYAGIVPASHLDNLSRTDREKRWLKTLSHSAEGTRVAVSASGQVLGWASFGSSRDEDGSGIGELYGIYLDHSSWGKGIGRRLLENVVASLLCKGFKSITLWVFEENHRTRAFYERAGFVHDGTSKHIEIAGKSLAELRYRKTSP